MFRAGTNAPTARPAMSRRRPPLHLCRPEKAVFRTWIAAWRACAGMTVFIAQEIHVVGCAGFTFEHGGTAERGGERVGCFASHRAGPRGNIAGTPDRTRGARIFYLASGAQNTGRSVKGTTTYVVPLVHRCFLFTHRTFTRNVDDDVDGSVCAPPARLGCQLPPCRVMERRQLLVSCFAAHRRCSAEMQGRLQL